MKTSYSQIPVYQTKDGSEIRELMHPDRDGDLRQSLAEAVIAPGQETALHKHLKSEELYHVVAGEGLMTLAGETLALAPGDTVRIACGTPHRVRNTGRDALKILCCCVPPYSHEDTVLL